MSTLESVLREAVAGLREEGVSFALVGGLAVSIRTEPRFTRDADLAVSVRSDADAKAVVHRLSARGWQVLAKVEQEATARLATVRLARSGDAQEPIADLLFASSGIETEIIASADHVEALPNLTIAVASTAHLIALKVLSRDDERRPQDLVDFRALLRVATNHEVARAGEALALITARGYNRNRDLAVELARLTASR